MPAPACAPMAIMSGILRPILKGKTGKHHVLNCGTVFRSQHALSLHQRWRSVGRDGKCQNRWMQVLSVCTSGVTWRPTCHRKVWFCRKNDCKKTQHCIVISVMLNEERYKVRFKKTPYK
jgi:hypothetical protein